jgi:hypothetical protein
MRHMPKAPATREDVYHLAMDLPVERARAFLEGLGLDRLRELGIGQEEFYLLKGRVAYARWQAQSRRERLLAALLQREIAQIDCIAASADHAAAVAAASSAAQRRDEAAGRLRALATQIGQIETEG